MRLKMQAAGLSEDKVKLEEVLQDYRDEIARIAGVNEQAIKAKIQAEADTPSGTGFFGSQGAVVNTTQGALEFLFGGDPEEEGPSIGDSAIEAVEEIPGSPLPGSGLSMETMQQIFQQLINRQ
jgi:hypothetical protein